MKLADLVQLSALGGKTGAFHTKLKEGGTIWMCKGKVVHALFGIWRGDEAVCRLLAEDFKDFTFRDGEDAPETSVVKTTDGLLLEAARLADELKQRQKDATRDTSLILEDMDPFFLSGKAGTFELLPGVNCIGRAPRNEICLADTSVSSYHAVIHYIGDALRLYDLESLNGTFLNGNRVQEKSSLSDGDMIHFGPILMKLQKAPDDAPSPAAS
jgi:hypothetical protein